MNNNLIKPMVYVLISHIPSDRISLVAAISLDTKTLIFKQGGYDDHKILAFLSALAIDSLDIKPDDDTIELFNKFINTSLENAMVSSIFNGLVAAFFIYDTPVPQEMVVEWRNEIKRNLQKLMVNLLDNDVPLVQLHPGVQQYVASVLQNMAHPEFFPHIMQLCGEIYNEASTEESIRAFIIEDNDTTEEGTSINDNRTASKPIALTSTEWMDDSDIAFFSNLFKE